MLASEIPRWKQLCSQPHILPRALDPLLTRRERREQLENSQQNGMVYGDRSNYGSPYHRPVSSEFIRQKSVPSEYAVPAVSMQSKTLPRGSPSVSQNSQPNALVTAIYAHVGRNDDQLSFNDGDVITLIGEKSDGWQYGFNANTGKYGWFPLSFTDMVNISQAMDPPQLLRAKSIGDLLDSKSQISDINMSYEMEMPGRSRRPRSLYESSMGKHVNSAPHMLGSGEMSAHTLPRHHSSYQPGQQMHHHNHMPPPPQNQMVPPPPQAPAPTQAPMAPPPPPPIANHNQSWASNSGFPPPPPPTDYHTDEDDQSTRSQMFANVSLRKTQTNDRSAPRLQ